jgi:class 3 adenylate cyclase
MEPRIQYTKTSDGVNIAYWTMGEGPPLLLTSPMNYTHVERELRFERLRAWYERLARDWRVIRFDPRGWGMSDRRARGYDLMETCEDLDAVVKAAGAEAFPVVGFFAWGPTAIAYAATRPDRSSHLVLWGTDPMLLWATESDSGWGSREQIRLVQTFNDRDWQLYTENIAALSLGWERATRAHEYAEFIRASVSQEFVLSWRENMDNDASKYLSDVHCPTLILHARDNSMLGLDTVGRLASSLPGAQLRALEGRSIVPFGRLAEDTALAINEFAGGATPPGGPTSGPSGTAIILFADIADSTALTERLGDNAFRAKARELASSLRVQIRESGGTPVEGPTLGDGVLATFSSAREAINAALRCEEAARALGFSLHLGLHAGDVSREKDPGGRDNVYGGAVNIAARISGLSAPGEVLVSDIVRGLARTSAGVTYEDRGERALKGVGEPVRVFTVRQV